MEKICMIGEKGNQGYLFRANDVTKCWCPLSILHIAEKLQVRIWWVQKKAYKEVCVYWRDVCNKNFEHIKSKTPFLSSDCPSFNVQGINCCLGKKRRIREVCGDIVIKMVIPHTLARDLDALALLFSDVDNNYKFISRWPQLFDFVLDKLTNALAFVLAFGTFVNVVQELLSQDSLSQGLHFFSWHFCVWGKLVSIFVKDLPSGKLTADNRCVVILISYVVIASSCSRRFKLQNILCFQFRDD